MELCSELLFRPLIYHNPLGLNYEAPRSTGPGLPDNEVHAGDGAEEVAIAEVVGSGGTKPVAEAAGSPPTCCSAAPAASAVRSTDCDARSAREWRGEKESGDESPQSKAPRFGKRSGEEMVLVLCRHNYICNRDIDCFAVLE